MAKVVVLFAIISEIIHALILESRSFEEVPKSPKFFLRAVFSKFGMSRNFPV
jgi:hypothetical protein